MILGRSVFHYYHFRNIILNLKLWTSHKTCKTPLGETGCLGNPYFTGCVSIQLFNWPQPLTQSVRLPMATYPSLCSSCVTCGTLCHTFGHQVLPAPWMTSLDVLQDAMPCQGSLTLIPREAEDFPRGNNQSKHMPLPTHLDWLQPIYYNFRFGFIQVNIGKAFTCC